MINRFIRVSTDNELPKIIKLVKKGILPTAETIQGQHAKYNVGANKICKTVETASPKSFYKEELLYNDDTINVITESLENDRGQYLHRAIDPYACNRESVSLGGQLSFVKRDDGMYVQPALGRYCERVVSREDLQKAINYVKGVGSVEAYNKLLRAARA